MSDMPMLTDEQRRVAEAGPEARLLVTAGPGTGKTHTLIARLSWLIARHDVSPGRGLLVLSFSRAAVREISDRTRRAADDVAYVRAKTFDSFATRLLSEYAAEDTSWSTEDYDGRIRAATRLVRESEDVAEELSSYEHILVDEIQDLVGVRAEFVKAILVTAECGFTLLGDPAQGIFNFSLEGEERRIGSTALYHWVRTTFESDLEECPLSENHRAKTAAARSVLWAGAGLNSTRPDYTELSDGLKTTLLRLHSVGKLDQAVALMRSSGRRTAVLCRTNGQALMISRTLHEANISHLRRRGADERVVPAWVAEALADVQQRSLGRSVFLGGYERCRLDGPEGDVAWDLLRRTAPGSGRDVIDLGRLEERIRTGYIPDEIYQPSQSDLVISTVHRAKGLEFECVLIAETGMFADDEFPEEECRVAYVALTRARSEIFRIETPPFQGLRRHEATDRWIRKWGWKVPDFEVRPDDLHRDDPPGGFRLDTSASSIQEYLRSRVKPEDPVALRLLDDRDGGTAFYLAEHEGNPIGITSPQFARRLYTALKISRTWRVTWPIRIEKLRLEGLETVGGTEAAAKRCGLPGPGIWLGARVAGMGALVFPKSGS